MAEEAAQVSVKSPEECLRWVQHVHEVQSKRTPEQMEAAKQRLERTRQHEVQLRKCKAIKGYSIRSRALASESLRQMSCVDDPRNFQECQARWRSSAEASRNAFETSYGRAHAAASAPPQAVSSLQVDADDEEEEHMHTVAQTMGSNVADLTLVGNEGLPSAPPVVRAPAAAAPPTPPPSGGGSGSSVQDLLKQLRNEPSDEEECTAKFMLYEGYGREVEQMRENLLKFHEESRPTVPSAVASGMDKEVKGIDSAEAMGIPDDAREWFVFHMMRQAERNNLKMAGVLDGFEKKLEFLASNEQAECPVCLEAFNSSEERAAETLGCCHKVCRECWAHWNVVTHGRPFCPLCRHDEFLGAVAARVTGRAAAAVDSDSD